MEEYVPIAPQTFENNGITYKYDFNILTIEQAELAREVCEFKFNQLQSAPDNFKQVIKSRGAEWLQIAMSYLLRSVKNNEIEPFNKDKAESDTEKFVRTLPVSFMLAIKECINDFFTGIGKTSLSLTLFQNEKKKSGIQTLLPILANLMQTNLKQDAL